MPSPFPGVVKATFFFLGIVLQSLEFMGMIALHVRLCGATVVLFDIISVVSLRLGFMSRFAR